jgi:hypothetical protein
MESAVPIVLLISKSGISKSTTFLSTLRSLGHRTVAVLHSHSGEIGGRDFDFDFFVILRAPQLFHRYSTLLYMP